MAKPLSDAARMAYLIGQVQALTSFAFAVAESHPNRSLLRDLFESASQAGLAKIETTLASDHTVAGFQDAADKIRRVLSE
jgi:hypothetical protein